ncbi:MAG: hypothetical protein ACPGWR_31020, partial [Ardenticatenaceae bacterium]
PFNPLNPLSLLLMAERMITNEKPTPKRLVGAVFARCDFFPLPSTVSLGRCGFGQVWPFFSP